MSEWLDLEAIERRLVHLEGFTYLDDDLEQVVRNDLPALLARVRALEAALAALEANA